MPYLSNFLFGLADRREHVRLAVIITICTDAKVNLLWVGVTL